MTETNTSPDEYSRFIEAWYHAGLDEVDPSRSVERAISWQRDQLTVAGRSISIAPEARVLAVAIGKAAAGMACGLDKAMGDRLDVRVILTRYGHAETAPVDWTVFEARHPIPDARGVDATAHIRALLTDLASGDVVIALISGGGSALFELPRPPLTLDDIQTVTRMLLQAGAPIQSLNAVRSELSEVKGGGLRATIGEATCISLILSDVLGNDPSIIASGPTIPREPQPAEALAILESNGIADRAPLRVQELLSRDAWQRDVPNAENDIYTVIGDNDSLVLRILREAEQAGFRTEIVLPLAEGEARELANHFLDLAERVSDTVDVVLGGGEATVTVLGAGEGGRNTEFALAAAIRLAESNGSWTVASLASDGQDGTLDSAGAIVDRTTVALGAALGFDAWESLEQNDSGSFFAATRSLVTPGPTGTNVNDVYIAIRHRRLDPDRIPG